MPDSERLKRKCGEVWLYKGEERNCYFGCKSIDLLKCLEYTDILQQTVLSGQIACSGEAIGKVRIVDDIYSAQKAKKGEIIVTSMTTPEIVAALECAGGIITDEGGVTCHASIIAREYGVPCLVGTKNATTTLHNGMEVQLDCFNGKVILLD